MNANTWNRMGRSALGLAAGGLLAAIAHTAWSQETPVPKPKPSPVAAPDETKPQDAAKTREQVRDTVKGAREDARDATKGAREAAEGARETAQDARRDARETIRDARADAREARREARRNWRAADFGLWFGGRAGASGLVIADVAPQGGIAKAGFLEGDRIVSINGTPVTTEAEFTRVLTDDTLSNQQVKVVVMRASKEQTITVQPSQLMQE